MSQKSGSNSGRFIGKFRGIVSNIQDPNRQGRIKFTCPEVFGNNDTESSWALPCIQCAYDGGGDIALPHVGETVWVEFEQGNSNNPIWVGNFWSSNETPFGGDGNASSGVGEDYGDSSRVISYAGCVIVMKDGTVTVQNGSGGSLVMTNGSMTINGSVSITGNLSVGGSTNVSGSTTSGSISSSSIKAVSYTDKYGEVHGGTISAEEGFKCKSIEVEENVDITGHLEVQGYTTVTVLEADVVNTKSCNRA